MSIPTISLVLLFATLIGTPDTTAYARQDAGATPTSTDKQLLEVIYQDVASGEKEGFIFVTDTESGREFAIYCVDGAISFSTWSDKEGTRNPIRPDYMRFYCDFESLKELVPPGATLVVNPHPQDGWTVDEITTDGKEVASRCDGSTLVTLQSGDRGEPIMQPEEGSRKCLSIDPHNGAH